MPPKTHKTHPPTVAQIAEMAQRQLLEAGELYDAKEMAAQLIRRMTARQDKVMLKLMGIDTRWGEWEFDRDSKSSPLGTYFADQIQPHLQKWLDDKFAALMAGELPKLDTALEKAVKKQVASYASDYSVTRLIFEQVRERLEAYVTASSRKLVEQALDAILPPADEREENGEC